MDNSKHPDPSERSPETTDEEKQRTLEALLEIKDCIDQMIEKAKYELERGQKSKKSKNKISAARSRPCGGY